MRPRDTTPEAYAVQMAALRRMPLGRGAELAAQLSEDARLVALAGIRQRHADYDDRHTRLALFRLLLGDELFRRAWPQAPLVEP
jgi:hypothetical protein